MAAKQARRLIKRKAVSTQRAVSTNKADSTQVLVTLSDSTGDVLKIQKLDKSGRQHELTAEELADLTGEDKISLLEDALEAAYAAGVKDALGNAGIDEQFLDRGVVRSLVLLRALGRSSAKKSQRPGTNGNGVH